MNNKILIFTATYNESENIKRFLSEISKFNKICDLLIIDDSSPDNTWKIIQDYQKNEKNIELIIREKKKD